MDFFNGIGRDITMHEMTVYAKSAKGRDEIATRAHKLAFKARSLLIMVDGETTVAQLNARAANLGDVTAYLGQLRDGGFIEPAGNIAQSTAPMPGADNAVVMPAEDTNAAASSPTATQLRDLSAAKVSAVKFIEDELGPHETDLAVKLEASQTHEQFLSHVETCRDVLKRAKGEKSSEKFWEEIVEQLG
jgi:hypothetical protein